MLMFMLMSFPVVLSMGMLMHAEFTCFMLVIMNSGTSFVAVGVVMLMTPSKRLVSRNLNSLARIGE